MKTVLFLCSGNYYRSRFAETFFNHIAARDGLDWRADSAALALERGTNNVGPLSRHAATELTSRGVAVPHPTRFPRQAQEQDFRNAAIVVALKEPEHRPLVEQRFPAWATKVTYWMIDDVGDMNPLEACAAIEREVFSLIAHLDNL